MRIPDDADQRSGMMPITITDLQSQKGYALRRADCGLVCFCALELVDMDVDYFLLNERQPERRVQQHWGVVDNPPFHFVNFLRLFKT